MMFLLKVIYLSRGDLRNNYKRVGQFDVHDEIQRGFELILKNMTKNFYFVVVSLNEVNSYCQNVLESL